MGVYVTYPLVVIHSSSLAARFDKSLPRNLKKEQGRLDDFVKKQGRKGFSCEADAQAAAGKVVKKSRFLRVEIQIEQQEVVLKRKRRGRPRKEAVTPTALVWTVQLVSQRDEDAIDAARKRRSCFMLITDHTDDERWGDARILGEYRRQYIVENHTGFRWLKSEGMVSPMFLETPERIRALGLVLVLSLMVRNFIQYQIRGELRRREETLPHPFTKKEENNLTCEMAMKWFWGVQAIQLSIDGSPLVRKAPQLLPTTERILALLGVDTACFSTPPKRIGPAPP